MNEEGTQTAETELTLDPAVVKLIGYAKEKRALSYDELEEFLPESIIDNTEKVEEVLALLEANNIELSYKDESEPEPPKKKPKNQKAARKKRLASGEKEAATDDPVRYYLREIGKETLLNAEQEIELSKQMEEGINIIKDVIRKSGMALTEFYHITQKAFSKKDPKELSLSKKEITEYMTERRRLNHFYKEPLRLAGADLKNYMELKRRLIAKGANLAEDKELSALRVKILEVITKAEIHPDEINSFSEKFLQASKKIKRLKKEQERIGKRLGVDSMRNLRALGRSLTVKEDREQLERSLGLTSDEIKEKIQHFQLTEKKL
ncbi:MAG: RNA polymerase sigma factor RpoD, partial [Spirochaetaceae bacterium]|nr:RNA polymerase sigma factor RpoD [Spirochaetaceae bacterium]